MLDTVPLKYVEHFIQENYYHDKYTITHQYNR